MNKYILTFCLLLGSQMNNGFAQSDSSAVGMSLSLKEAMETAVKNNYELKKAGIDVKISNETVKQTVAIGLPQVSATGNYQSFVTIPGQWIKNFAPTPGAPDYIFLQFQQKYVSSGSLGVNQLLFDGSYLVGLKATQEFLNMSKYLEAKTKYDVQVSVCKSYLMAASTQMNLELIRSNIKAVEKTLNDVKALNKEGFTEDLDVKRLQLSLNNLVVQEKKIVNVIETLMNLLKIQMGIDVSQKIVLSDNIEKINSIFTVNVDGEISLNSTQNRPEFNIIKQSIRLGELDRKRYQMGMLPRLVGFYQHQENTQRPEFNFFKDQSSLTINNSWVPSDVVGLQIQWTLFDGLNTASKIREVKYKTDKAKTDLAAFSNAAFAEALNAQKTYINQLDQAASQKQNMDLAQEIYKMANLKFAEGVGSSLEIVQSETELKNAQINYLNALYDLVVAKIDYQKSLGLGINF
ncbi:MAG: hypothetical protein RL263_938 [Bacteroidota bacterium]